MGKYIYRLFIIALLLQGQAISGLDEIDFYGERIASKLHNRQNVSENEIQEMVETIKKERSLLTLDKDHSLQDYIKYLKENYSDNAESLINTLSKFGENYEQKALEVICNFLN